MKNVSSQGAILSHRYLKSVMAIGLIALIAGCNKDKEAPAVIEEVPSSATVDTDTSATLAEEPDLQQVGKDPKPGSAKNTFHPSGSANKAGFSDAGSYVVQVAVFKSKRQAANLVEKLANTGYPAYVAEVESPVPDLAGTYHRVRIGKFMRLADAKSFGDNTLKPNGYDYWVDNKKNDAVSGDGSGYSAPAPTPAYEAPAASQPAYEPAAPSEPAVPSGETWGTPKTEEPAATPPSTPSTPATSAPAADTGKVNLDEW